MKVIGAGLPRTGTMSLQAALNRLGYRCYHMQNVPREKGHTRAWNELVAKRSAMDWKTLFRDYQATVDAPACFYFADLLREFPEAKVILTVRDPERWYESVKKAIFRTIQPWRPLGYVIPSFGQLIRLVDRLFDEFIAPTRDKEAFIAGYERHVCQVQQTVPSDRLLVFRVQDGWEPLCSFLECEIPKDMPYPHLNEGDATLKVKLREIFPVVPVLIALIVAASLAIAALVWLIFA